MYISIRHRDSSGSVANGFEARASAQPILFQVTVPPIPATPASQELSTLTIDLSHLSPAEKQQDVEFIVQGALTVVKRGPHSFTVNSINESLVGTIEIKTVECTLIGTIVTGDKVKFDFPIR
ncbi:hypothetical protein KBI23_05980 [bacterium]|jgi:hypothetical protein|nr:hypothetical protein [bacterium]MBP9810491.1 hypothetical protein [bacterium]